MLLSKDIDLKIDFKISQRTSIPSLLRQELYLIFKEAINNIVKHSMATIVLIEYQHNDRGFHLSIENNGYTEKDKKSTKGQGLRNMKMRAGRVHAVMVSHIEGGNFTILITSQ